MNRRGFLTAGIFAPLFGLSKPKPETDIKEQVKETLEEFFEPTEIDTTPINMSGGMY